MSYIKEILTKKAAAAVMEAAPTPHKKIIGKAKVVDRVIGGEVQLRKTLSNVAGYKVVDGLIVKMNPEEVRNRKRAAKITARKRKGEQARIQRHRNLSMAIRDSRLGGAK